MLTQCHIVILLQPFSNCGTRTTGDTIATARWYNWRQVESWIFSQAREKGENGCQKKEYFEIASTPYIYPLVQKQDIVVFRILCLITHCDNILSSSSHSVYFCSSVVLVALMMSELIFQRHMKLRLRVCYETW